MWLVSDMENLENKIIEWHKATFPNATFLAKRKKLLEECCELITALHFGNIQEALEEAADVFIVAVSLAMDRKEFEENVSMSLIIADKLEVNKKRQWGSEDKNGDRPRVK